MSTTRTVIRRRTSGAVRVRRLSRSTVFHLGMIVLIVIILYPGAWMIVSSFRNSNDIIGNVGLALDHLSWHNFATALAGIGGVPSLQFFANSLILALGSVVGTIASSCLTAYAFARITFAGRKLWFNMMIGTLLLPFQVVIIPQYIIFQKLGVMDTYIPLLLGKFLATDAFFVFLMVQFMRNLPGDLDEAAKIDGAGHWRTFRSIIFPLMKPALISSSIFAFIWSWNDFIGPLLYLNTPSKWTVSLALRTFVDQTANSDYGAMLAMSLLALMPVIFFFLVFQRFLVDGVSTQGLKG